MSSLFFKTSLKFVSWNVNGLRACIKKGFWNFFNKSNADFFCIQETKMRPEQADIITDGYKQYWNSAEKKGYSGTAIFTKLEPISFSYGMGIPQHDYEGRVITLEFQNFFLVNVYTPNSKEDLSRLDYRVLWEDDFKNYLLKLKSSKAVVLCGDLNVAHREIDLKNPKTNKNHAGFTESERNKIDSLLTSGFTDTFRFLHKDKVQYSWWSYRANARKNNSGWRIDYFLVSDDLNKNIKQAYIHDSVLGSDHCPIELLLDK